MDTLFKSSNNFASLSLKDLVDARDQFHYHLINKKNVIATAVGLYRIRHGDPWPSEQDPKEKTSRSLTEQKRTLGNSEVRPYSWPCVYAFVTEWEYQEELARTDPSDVVPKSLWLPDGRAVPVCVIEAPLQPWSKDLKVARIAATPRNLLGPGSAIVNEDSQGLPRLATAGCIVRDGDRYYAITNKHAVGAAGNPIHSFQPHRRPKIGTAAEKGLTREDFGTVYPHFPSTRQRVLMDIGLVELDDITKWKSEIPGISPVGSALDLYDYSLSLRLIGMKVVGRGAVSGLVRGEIQALFYRYKAIGGSEYVSDFLIGPETLHAPEAKDFDPDRLFAVHHGDSGTLLLLEQKPDGSEADGMAATAPIYRPFAVLWGREEIFSDGTESARPFALATSLSTALDLLDLDIVRDINFEQDFVWGWVGHYVIGRALPLATDLLMSEGLRSFVELNLDLLALTPDDALGNDPKVVRHEGDEPQFVPLADVPDNVWKSNVNFVMVDGPDGRKKRKPGPGSRGQNDNPNHFADLDLPYLGRNTFLELLLEDPDQYLTPKAWISYFAAQQPKFDAWDAALGQKTSKHWGALPFRVHQLFDVMVAAAKDGNAALFLCAGGVLIHYVGDACQPLHMSYKSQGDPDRLVPRPRSAGMKYEADGVHGGYEDDMIAFGYQNGDLDEKLKTEIEALGTNPGERIEPIANGFDASKAIIRLSAATRATLEPTEIVEKWVELKGGRNKPEAMWDAFGGRTITCMARGARYLAAIWEAAWAAGGGEQNVPRDAKVQEPEIMRLYNDSSVVPSIRLDAYPDDPSSDWSEIAVG